MKIIKTVGIIILLTIIQLIAFIIATQLIEFGPDFKLTQEEAAQSGSMLAAISFINSIIILYFFKRVKNTDYKLLFWFVFTWFGIGTIMGQTDTWYYIDAFPLLNNSLVLKICLMQFIVTILVIPASFFIVSRKSNELINFNIRGVLNLNFLKYLLFISIVYALLYYLAGYFIAWQYDAIRVHYSGSLEKLSFLDHTLQLVKKQPDFFPFHMFRGALWFCFSIPVFMALSKRENGYYIFSFLFFALVPTLPLFLPNPLMLEAVRMGHFVETSISNGIFGLIAAYVWRKYELKFLFKLKTFSKIGEQIKIKAPFLALIIAFMFNYACSENQDQTTEEIVEKSKEEEKDTVDLVFNSNGEINQESIDSNSIFIPKGKAVSIDGVIEENEWVDAKKMDFKGGGFTLFKCDASFLYLCIQGDKLGISSVAVNTGHKIFILHSSAGLITAIYEKEKKIWNQIEEFRSARQDMIRIEKNLLMYEKKFLKEFNWFANRFRPKGKPDFNLKNKREYKISLDMIKNGSTNISIVFFQRTASEQYAQLPVSLKDGSINSRLVHGGNVSKLNFTPEKWITLYY